MKTSTLVTVALGLLTASAFSAFSTESNPTWMRYPAISPDGREIAFAYRGDLYKVSVSGGDAQRLTTHEAYDTTPVWSPDGRRIAFVSDRYHGSRDIYIMPAEGGAAKRLTTHSAKEKVHTFTPDGRYILFSAHYQDPVKSILFPTGRFTEIYRVPAEGGATEQVLGIPAGAVVCSRDGKSLVYQDLKGFENEWRKHHTSSVTRDIIRYDLGTGTFTPLVRREGEDLDPVLSADGKTLYFLSERGGTMNLFKKSEGGEAVKLTSFEDHPVRFLSRSDEGTLCFGWDGEIYTLKEGEQPVRVPIRIVEDGEELPSLKSFTSGVRAASVSPDGKELAIQVRGEIFVTSGEYSTTKRITDTPAVEEGVSFGAGSRMLVYDSQRDGERDIYVAHMARSEDPNFANATVIDERPLIPGNKEEKMRPEVSPDGKQVAFIMNRRYLMVYNMETGKLRQVMENVNPISSTGSFPFSWSPDSRWIVVEYSSNHHAPFSDLGLIDVTAAKPKVRPLVQSGYFDTNPRFVMDGNAILFASDRYGMKNLASWGSEQDIMIIFLNREAYEKYQMNEEEYALLKEQEKNDDKKEENKNKKEKKTKKPEPIRVEWEGMDRRIVRLTTASGDMGDAFLSPDGEKLYYLSAYEGGYDLWKMELRKRTPKLLKKLNGSGYYFLPDSVGNTIYMVSSKDIQKLTLPSEELKPVTFRAEMTLDPAQERKEMFEVVRREEGRRFYRKDMHGVDWEALTTHYEKFLPHISNNYDFSEMLSEMLGELNVSHTGSGYRASSSAPVTAELGLFIHRTKDGKGLVVDEVVAGGPFDSFRSKLKAGDIIEAIDGNKIDPNSDYYPLLAGKSGKSTLFSLHSPSTGNRWDEVVKPITPGKMSKLLYDRWIRQRADEVDRLSEGRLGYAHVASMDDESFRTLYGDALGKYYQREGMVVDIRYNGGGRLHEDLEVFLSATKYLTQEARGRYYCDMPSRRWTKPSVMVICEADYSNAHGSPWVYKHMGIGKLVGMPVPGTMTSVNWVTLQDPSLYFGIPAVGYKTAEGNYLENSQLDPDIKAPLDMTQALNGHDTQLEASVRSLLK